MEIAQPSVELQSVIRRVRAGAEIIDLAVDRICPVSIDVVKPRQARCFASDVTNLKRRVLARLLLDVEIPAVYVGRAQVVIRNENTESRGPDGIGGEDGLGVAPVNAS